MSPNNNDSNETHCESTQVLSNETIEDMGQSSLSMNDLTSMHGLEKTSACKSKRVKRDPTKVLN